MKSIAPRDNKENVYFLQVQLDFGVNLALQFPVFTFVQLTCILQLPLISPHPSPFIGQVIFSNGPLTFQFVSLNFGPQSDELLCKSDFPGLPGDSNFQFPDSELKHAARAALQSRSRIT